MTRVPLARPFVQPSLHHFHSFHDPAPGFGSERTHREPHGRRARRRCRRYFHRLSVTRKRPATRRSTMQTSSSFSFWKTVLHVPDRMTYRKPRFRQADYEESDDEFVMGHLGMWKRVQNIRRDPRVALSMLGPNTNAQGLRESLVV